MLFFVLRVRFSAQLSGYVKEGFEAAPTFPPVSGRRANIRVSNGYQRLFAGSWCKQPIFWRLKRQRLAFKMPQYTVAAGDSSWLAPRFIGYPA